MKERTIARKALRSLRSLSKLANDAVAATSTKAGEDLKTVAWRRQVCAERRLQVLPT